MTELPTIEPLPFPCPELFDIHACAVAYERQGEAAEAGFMAKASNLGFAVAKPWGRERYDFILDSGHNFWRVQVKSTRCGYYPTYWLTVASPKLQPYTKDQIDYLAAYIIPEDLWFIIPVEKIAGRKNLYFNPLPGNRSPWEKYREAWCQMACPNEENGPSKIVAPRCKDLGLGNCKSPTLPLPEDGSVKHAALREGPMAREICPLKRVT
jgi:PD-(D/E)XK endonuclease